MCSYNAENGRPSCANDFILNKQLRSWKPAALLQDGGSTLSHVECIPVGGATEVLCVHHEPSIR